MRPKKELSPMAHNILQKLTDLNKTKAEDHATIDPADKSQNQ